MLIAFGAVLSGCFSPWAGHTANITINLGQGEAGRKLVNARDEARMEHIITLKGPDSTISRRVSGGGSVFFEVSPGKWRIDVRAIGDRPDEFPGSSILGGPAFPARMLRAIGLASVDVKGGANVTVPIKMTTATEAENWDKLLFVIENADPSGEEIILLTANMTADTKATLGEIESLINIPANITLMADRDITIKRGIIPGIEPIFIITYGSSLSLGKSGMAGTISIDGGKRFGGSAENAHIYIVEGILRMYPGVALSNNSNVNTYQNFGGAVHINAAGSADSAKFYMHGGAITGNESMMGSGVFVQKGIFSMSGGNIWNNSTTSGSGGGVNVSNNGSFFMTGGAITGNSATYQGGGVAIQGGAFDMAGTALISGNTAANGGGGVVLDYVMPNVPVFTMMGGTISNNTTVSSISGGGGVLINIGSSFTMKDGAITGNKASESNGGGVYFVNNSASGHNNPFSMEGGAISGNESKYGGGVYIANSAYFEMTGGSISGNTAAQFGGGVMADSQGNIEISGGAIGGSNRAINGGGVYLNQGSVITMSGSARIIGNTAASNGGGVYLSKDRYSGMSPYSPNFFIMEGGTIGGNIAGGNGAGIFSISFPSGGSFINRVEKFMEGIIYGNDAGKNSNIAGNGNKGGHAAYYQYGPNIGDDFIYRDTIVKHNDQLWAYGQTIDGNIGWDGP